MAHINFSIGYLFNFPIRIGGMLMMLLGIAITLTGIWGVVGGLALIFVGGYFAFTATGISIDLENKAVRHYTRLYGLLRGNWNEYPTYPNICIIRKNRKKKSRFDFAEAETESPYQFEIYLVSRSHRGKVLLQIHDTREQAEIVAKHFAEEMNCELVEYTPPNRTKTREHRHKHHGQKTPGEN